MKYDKKAISNTAQNLRSKTSGLSSVQTRLGRISPTKCSSAFYTRRSSLVRRLSNVQSEIKSLSTDIGNAASKMSSDDVQNARYIRQVFNNRTSKLNFGQRTFSAGNTTLKRGGLFGSSLMYTQMAMNRRPVSSLGNASSGYTPWFVKAGNFISSGASSIGKKAGEFGSNVWNGTTNFFSKAGKWTADRFNDAVDWGKSAGDYTWKSLKKLVLGDYSDDDITALSFGGSIAAGIFDVDLPLDVRDFVYDIQHWGEGDHFGVYFALDCIAFVPLIGAVKYVKYADEVADGAKDIGKVMEAASDAGKYSDQAVDAAKQAKKAEKAAGAAVDAGKTSDTVVDAVEDVSDVGKKADAAADAGKVAGDANDFISSARKAADNYNLDEERYMEHIVGRHEYGSPYKPNKESKFIKSFDIRKGIRETLTDLSVTPKPNTFNRPGYIFIKEFDKVIGTAADGTKVYKLKVVLDEAGNVITAYPIK